MELFVGVILLGVLLPVAMWLGDESSGRASWRRVTTLTEHLDLGQGAFRAQQVELAHQTVLRERAPWWVRLVALSCYLPIGAAVVAALPWIVGCLFAAERGGRGLDAHANAVLVVAYPFGVWAAVRMARLGRALLGGERERFREALGGTALLQLVLNAAISAAGLALYARYRRDDALMLLIAPAITIAQTALVGLVGLRETSSEPRAVALDPAAETAPSAPAP